MPDTSTPEAKSGSLKRRPRWMTIGCTIAAVIIALPLLYLGYAVVYNVQRWSQAATPSGTPMPALTTAQIEEMAVALPYDDLARETEKHVGKIVHYRGTVIQVVGDSLTSTAGLRVMISGSRMIYLHYSGPRVLEGDIVDFHARVDGRLTYQTVLRSQMTVPEATALLLEITND